MKTNSMKTKLLASAILALCAASASAQVTVDFRDADGSTNSTYIFAINDVDSGFGFDMEMVMTATLTGGTGTTFSEWSEASSNRGLGFADDSGSWSTWIDTESSGSSTEGVTLTFREAGSLDPVEVDLGAGGLSIYLLGRDATNGDTPTINGSDIGGLTTGDFNTVIASSTGLSQITAFANESNDQTVFALDTLDIADAAVIPEPSTFALFAGALGLALVMLRRRR